MDDVVRPGVALFECGADNVRELRGEHAVEPAGVAG